MKNHAAGFVLLCVFTPAHAAPELVLQTGHSGELTAFACAPDSEFCVTAAKDRTVRLWNAKSGALHRVWRVPGIVTALAFTRGGRFAAGDGAALTAFSLNANAPLWCWKPPAGNQLRALCAAPDGAFFAAASNVKAKSSTLWQLGAGGAARQLASSTIDWGVLAASNALLGAGDGKGDLALWEIAGGKVRGFWKAHESAVRALAFSPDGKTLVSGGNDCRVRFWDAATGAAQRTLTAHLQPISALSFSSNGDTLAVRSGPEIKLWNAADGSLRGAIERLMRMQPDDLETVALTPGGVIAANDGPLQLKRWNATTSEHIGEPLGGTDGAANLHFDADGTLVALQSSWIQWGNPPVWKVSSLPNARTSGASKSPAIFASAGDYGITLWHRDGSLSKVPLTIEFPLREVALSPDHKTLAITDWDEQQQGAARICELATAKTRRILRGLGTLARYAAFSPDGKWLAVSCQRESAHPDYAAGIESDGELHSFRVADGQRLQVLRGYRGEVWRPAFSPDGRFLAVSGQEKLVHFFSFASGQARELANLPFPEGQTEVVAFSPDGKTLAAAGSGYLRLWDVKTGRELRAWRGHDADINALAWAPNGKVLVSGSDDGTTAIWNVAPGTARGAEEQARTATFEAFVAVGQEAKEVVEWLAWTPRGEFACSPGAEKFLRWRDGDTLKTPAELPQLRRDDLVVRALRGE